MAVHAMSSHPCQACTHTRDKLCQYSIVLAFHAVLVSMHTMEENLRNQAWATRAALQISKDVGSREAAG